MTLPRLDLHAHVSPDIEPFALNDLDAVIFAVTRNLDEAEQALRRRDARTVWGVGVHPGLVGPHKSFDPDRFRDLLARAAFVGEVGLDGKSRVDKQLQLTNLRTILASVADMPRIVSLHSYDATRVLLDELDRSRVPGAVLHWWLGDVEETRRAVEMGCYFSVNPSSARRADVLAEIPLARVLPETDHPSGDRFGQRPRRPGNAADVEATLGQAHGQSPSEVRHQVWQNLKALTAATAVGPLLPPQVWRLLS